jgi:hypothetical protein
MLKLETFELAKSSACHNECTKYIGDHCGPCTLKNKTQFDCHECEGTNVFYGTNLVKDYQWCGAQFHDMWLVASRLMNRILYYNEV